MDSIVGTEGSLVVRFVVAFVIVLALIGITFWLIRRFGGARVGSAAQRGRAPRLAVIDAAAVDGRRRLVLVRRDNVEHLLMIGGPSDIVVEQNILRAVPVNAPRDVPAPRAAGVSEAPPRAAAEPQRAQPFEDDAWPQQPEPPARPSVTRPDLTLRPRAIEPRPIEPRQAEQRHAEPRHVEPRPFEPRTFEPRPLEPRPLEPRAFAEPPVRPAPVTAPRSLDPVPPPIAPAAEPADEAAPPDAALASMAQRLEAALRRPGGPEAPRSTPPMTAPPMTAEQRIEAAFELPHSEQTSTAPDLAPGQTGDKDKDKDKGAKPKSVLDSLEEEMASLLGRPPEKT
jgi:flagellar biogenesis protein FliO